MVHVPLTTFTSLQSLMITSPIHDVHITRRMQRQSKSGPIYPGLANFRCAVAKVSQPVENYMLARMTDLAAGKQESTENLFHSAPTLTSTTLLQFSTLDFPSF